LTKSVTDFLTGNASSSSTLGADTNISKDLIIEQGYFQFAIKNESGEGAHDAEDAEVTPAEVQAFRDRNSSTTLTREEIRANISLDRFVASNEASTIAKETGTMDRATELSGNYVIERRIGDLYKWTGGNEYIYGGDNVYDFGNSHDEFHINESGIDENAEAFSIPVFRNARGTSETPDGTMYNWGDDTRAIDSQNQMVEMKWGDEYAYHHGRRFDWCSDPADYNFGNGYTENLINSNEETINDTHIHDKAVPGGPLFATINGSLVTGLEAGSIATEKTIGNSYGYTKGNSLEVSVGDSESYTYGNSHDITNGNAHEEVNGNSTSHVRGTSVSTYHGATEDKFMGAASTLTFGVSSEISLAVSSSIQVGASNDMFLGLKTDLCVSAGFEMAVGPMNELFAGPAVDTKMAGEIKALMGPEITIATTALDTKITDIKTNVSNINNKVTEISSGMSFIQTKATTLRSGATVIDGTAITLM
jgi:type VI secretion system secreted protein VgrG